MDKNQRMILIELMNHEYVSGTDLAHLIHMSTRSVRTIMKNLTQHIIGARIESGNYGYKLIIEEPEKYLEYLQQKDIPQDDQARFEYIMNRFIESDDYIKIEDLCDELYLSRTQLKQSLKNVRTFFNDYGVVIATRTHHGMYLDGNEVHIRKAIVQFGHYQKDSNVLEYMRKIMISCIANADYVMSDDVLEDIVSLLYVSYIRIKKNKNVSLDEEWMKELKEEKEYELACSIMALMSQMMGIKYQQEEIAYLTMNLCGKNCQQHSHMYIDEHILNNVDKILKVLEEESHIPFASDLNLQLALSLHMIPLMKRIQYLTYMNNPLVSDIKRTLIRAYELAIKATAIINEEYHCQLPEDEIAYFALHINLSLEQNQYMIHRKNILVVCSSGVGSAKLLEYYFKNNFGNYIQRITVCSKYELEKHHIENYDCIFTTIPLDGDFSIPVFLIHNFMNQKDTMRITQNLKDLNQSSLIQYFPENLFFTYESFTTKEQAIHELVQQCHQYYELPNNFEELVLEREQLSTTEFNDFIAFPHSHKPVSSSTFVCVALLKKPLLWKTKKVRIILLSSIENKVMKELDNFYKVISTLMSDSTLQWQLLQNPTYEQFKTILEGIDV